MPSSSEQTGGAPAAQLVALLNQAGAGNVAASAELLPLVYAQLRALAEQKMRQEQSGQTLQATALVHEAYLRLVDGCDGQPWNSRGHFFAAAAEAMRRILVEKARHRQRLRHGGGRQRVELDHLLETHPTLADDDGPADALLALDEALTKLAAEEPEAAQVVQLRYFAGLTVEQAAETLGISVRTTNRHWGYAKAWLYERLASRGEDAR